MKTTNLSWRTDNQIRASSLRVIDKDGKQVGVLTLSEALKKAADEKLTLVEIAPKAVPPVAKIVDFGKFRYQEEKKARETLKKSKPSELKEVRFSPFIAENDYNTRLNRVKEFLGEKNKVKLVVAFKGRQLGSKQFGYNLFNSILTALGDGINIDMKPKFLGRNLIMIVSPTSAYGKTKNKEADNQ